MFLIIMKILRKMKLLETDEIAGKTERLAALRQQRPSSETVKNAAQL